MKLILRRPGQDDVSDVRVRRSFPWSRPGRFISVRNGEGKESMLIDDVNALSPTHSCIRRPSTDNQR